MSEPWKTDKWFVSPWNFESEVTANFDFPRRIKIHDITLRDGEQQAGIALRKDEKVRIAVKLAEAGVHRIETGMPATSKDDELAIKEIVKLGLDAEIFCFSRCMIDDVKRAVDCGVSGVIIEIPSSEHIINYCYKWPLQKAIDLSIRATSYAKEQGLYTVFFPIDATRAKMDWYLDLIEKVATEGHMDALALVDTFGVLSPQGVSYFVKKTRERIKKPLETHFHDDFGMAVANTIMGLAAGAEVAHVTVTGIGERAGNAALEDTVLTLLTMYGIDTGIKYEKLYELSKMVREYTGLQIPSNRPIVGDMLFNIESGIPTAWARNVLPDNPTEIFPFHWDLVGQNPPEIVMGKYSGRDSIAWWLEKAGLRASESQIDAMLPEVKEKSIAKKGLLTKEEFQQIAEKHLNG